ncbi:protein FAM151B [Xylocopa sonorina]|uniref:protein FAM151B n=1 Tax=Xylocopa sonorina TaxID=1818115 RepID=UPI00403A9C18
MKSVTSTATSLLILATIQAAMSTTNVTVDPSTFFAKINGNLTKIVWAHAVNNKTKLEKALKSDDIMMLEGDVSLGKYTESNSSDHVPIMAHPPANASDLSLEAFVNATLEKNASKGIKLDFKSIEAFKASKPVLDRLRNDTKVPVFLNADILSGPVNATAKPVDAEAFLAQAKMYPEFILSVGWTTRYGVDANITEGRYTKDNVKDMIQALTKQQITQPITYPVRAGLAANDTDAIKALMKDSSSQMKNVTLTVWSSEGDKVDAERLSALIKDVGVDKVYVDVPQDLMKNLSLMTGASSANVASVTLATSLALAALLSTIL